MNLPNPFQYRPHSGHHHRHYPNHPHHPHHPHHPNHPGTADGGGTSPVGQGCGQPSIEQEFAALASLIQQFFSGLCGQDCGGNGGAFGIGGFATESGEFGFFGFGEFGECQPRQPDFEVEVKNGKPVVDLGNYILNFNEASSEWSVTNKRTGATTRVWGDPHVNEQGPGGNNWDFHKNMTFELEDGTKITVKTVPGGGNTTLSSELDITRGDQGIRVTGLAAGDQDGKLNIEKTDGYLLDWATPHGPVVHEVGSHWQTDDGRTVDQSYASQNL